MAQQKKGKRIGRPRLPKGEAKGHILQVGLEAKDWAAVKAKAKASNQPTSQWLRSILNAAIER